MGDVPARRPKRRPQRRSIEKIRDSEILTLKGPKRFSDGGGLYLRVDASGARRGEYKFTLHGSTHWMRCGGGILAKTTAQAVAIWTATRIEAAGYRALKAKGIDPLHHFRIEQQKEQNRKTVRDCGQAVLANKRKEGLSEGTMKVWVRVLEKECESISDRFVDEIETKDIIQLVQSMRSSTGEVFQNKVEEVLAYAIAHGFRTGPNPAAWKGHLEHILPKRQKHKHHAVLHYKDLGAFLTRLRSGTDRPMARLALEWLILTATRSKETRRARWCEIDRQNDVWIIPPERMKTRIEHKVPLSRRALEILCEVERWGLESDFIFAGMRKSSPLSGTTLQKFLPDNSTLHGNRSAFRDWAGDETSFAKELCEHALSHVVGDASEQAYRHAKAVERRRPLMQTWADYLSGTPNENVLQFRKVT